LYSGKGKSFFCEDLYQACFPPFTGFFGCPNGASPGKALEQIHELPITNAGVFCAGLSRFLGIARKQGGVYRLDEIKKPLAGSRLKIVRKFMNRDFSGKNAIRSKSSRRIDIFGVSCTSASRIIIRATVS